MDTKFLVNTVVAAVALFFFGFVMYEFLVADFMAGYMTQSAMPVMWAIGVSQLALGALLARFSSGHDVVSGMKSAAFIGLLYNAAVMFDLFGTQDVFTSLTGVVVALLMEVVRLALAGAVLGWWMGRSKAA